MAVSRSIRVEANSEYGNLSVRKLLERYSGNSFSLMETLKRFEETPAAIEPDVGGRHLDLGELRAGDIVLATTDVPGAYGIPTEGTEGLVSRLLIYQNDPQQMIDSRNNTLVETTVDDLLDTSQAVACFRIQVGNEADADQKDLGKLLADEAAKNVGKAMSASDINLNRPAWVKVPRPFFGLDRQVFSGAAAWIGFVHLGVPRVEGGYFPFYCSWLHLDTLSTVGKTAPENLRFWFTVDDYIEAKLDTIKIFQPLGYIGHLKSPA
jgi:hypothetical protein